MSKCLDVIMRTIFTSDQKFMKSFSAYILECCDNSYYTGYTDNLEARLEQHMFGETNSYVSSRKPFKLVWSATFGSRDCAKQAEKQIKGWSRAKKKALIDGDFELLKQLAKKKFKK